MGGVFKTDLKTLGYARCYVFSELIVRVPLHAHGSLVQAEWSNNSGE